jgi:hypothetical protein
MSSAADAGPDRRQVVCTGTVRVAMPPARAIELFTPSGERAWVEGWDPAFPAAESDDETAPGAVFVTEGDHGTVTWVVAGRTAASIVYARVTAGVSAGLVEVRCEEGPGGTAARVTYRLTALSAGAVGELEAFEAGFEALMGHWERAIAAAVPRFP